jgi:glutamate transport system permease protein
MSAQEPNVLYDAPGPRARRLTLIVSVVAAALVVLGAYAWVYRPLADKGQFTYERWGPLLDPANEAFPAVWRLLGTGFRNTVIAAAMAIVLSLVLGTALAVLRYRLTDIARGPRPSGAALPGYYAERGLGLLSRVFVEFFRGLPVVLTIFFVAQILPELGVDLEPRYFLVIGLTLYNMVVIGEIVRSGMANLPRGQQEAAEAIGLSGLQTVFSILLPQSFRVMLPALISQVVVVLKDTSFGFIIGYEEALRVSGFVVQNLGNPIQVYLVVGVLYILLNYLVSRIAVYAQRRVSRGRRTPPGAAVPQTVVPETTPGVGAPA